MGTKLSNWDGKERRIETSVFTQSEKENLIQSVKDIHLILTGNGHPENGLVYKSHRNTEFRLFWEKFGWIILAGFAGVPCTVVAGIVLWVVKGA